MVQYTNHIRLKWLQRGDSSTTLTEAWDSGVGVDVQGYKYDEARLHTETGTALLRIGSSIVTVITIYNGVRYRFKVPVKCHDCGAHHHSTGECPGCGSERWSLR